MIIFDYLFERNTRCHHRRHYHQNQRLKIIVLPPIFLKSHLNFAILYVPMYL